MRNSRKITLASLLGLGGLPALSLVACGGGVAGGSSNIGLVTDAGSINDKSFNQQAWEGVKAVDPGVTESRNVVVPNKISDAELMSGYKRLLTDGIKTIVTPGFFHAPAIEKFNEEQGSAKDNVKFMLLDTELKGGRASNVAELTYDTLVASFLAGYLTSLWFEAQPDQYPEPKVGMWGGGNFPGVTDFMVGLVYGIKYYNDNRATGKKAVSFVAFQNKDDFTNTDFNPGGKGRPRADLLVAEGAKVIFPVAGPQISDVFAAARAADKTDIRVIGVDTDMAKRYEQEKNWFITSVLKNIKDSVVGLYKVITNAPDADKETFKGLGAVTRGSFANKLTKLADNTNLGAWSNISDPASFYQRVIDNKDLISEAEKLTAGKTWDNAYDELIKLDNNDVKA